MNMMSNNVTAFILAISAAGVAPGGAAATPFAPPAPAARLTQVQQSDPSGAVAIYQFCACYVKRLAVEPTLVYKKVPRGGKCTRYTKNGSKYEKVNDTTCCVAVWLCSGVI